jgi:6-phosphogluconolactonase
MVLAGAAAVTTTAAALVERSAATAIATRGRFQLVLAGGETPRDLYERLGPKSLDWTKTEVFFGDERCVPPDDPASNYRMVRRALLDRVLPDSVAVHRIQGELAPAAAAALYDAEIRRVLARDPFRFDLVLLGLGADGHTASLFPDGAWLDEQEKLVVASRAPTHPEERVTLTLPLLNAAREVVFLVTGKEKADAFRRVEAGEDLPAARVRPDRGRAVWLVDELANRRHG